MTVVTEHMTIVITNCIGLALMLIGGGVVIGTLIFMVRASLEKLFTYLRDI